MHCSTATLPILSLCSILVNLCRCEETVGSVLAAEECVDILAELLQMYRYDNPSCDFRVLLCFLPVLVFPINFPPAV
jgi:hypothetical protein